MRARSAILAAAIAAFTPTVFAAAFPLLNFEDVPSNQPLQAGKRYQGVEFSSNAWIVSGGFIGDAVHQPEARALRLAVDPTDDPVSDFTSFSMTFAGGFIDRVGFKVSTWLRLGALSVQLKDAAGAIIQIDGKEKLSIADTVPCTAQQGLSFCNWQNVDFSFAGTAQTIIFTGGDQRVLLDNLDFTVPGATNRVPEPADMALTLSALAALGFARRRARQG
jgi:MYXO-CTERM domain-containing protein